MQAEQPVYFSNYNLDMIVMPVKVTRFIQLLHESNYNESEVQFLEDGLTNGFSIGYEGLQDHRSLAVNIPLMVGSEVDLWNKLMKEVKLGRVAGPFDEILFEHFIQSPIGLVPKA